MFFAQWLKLLLPIIGEYLKEFINPTAEENKTTKTERIVALIIAVLVLCLTSILDRTMTINKELSTVKTELVETKRKVKERDKLIDNIKFYLDRCDARIDDISNKLLPGTQPIELTVETVEEIKLEVEQNREDQGKPPLAPIVPPVEKERAPTKINSLLLKLISEENEE